MKKGFTLLELVVVIMLIGIFTTVGMVSFQRTNQRKEVENAAARIRQIYMSAKANALAGKKNCRECGASAVRGYACGSGDTRLMGWEVVLDTNPSAPNIRQQGVCLSGSPNQENPDGNDIRFSMEGGVSTVRPESLSSNLQYSISIPGGAGSVIFRPVTGGVVPTILSSQQIVVTVSNPLLTRSFTIRGDGSVSELQ